MLSKVSTSREELEHSTKHEVEYLTNKVKAKASPETDILSKTYLRLSHKGEYVNSELLKDTVYEEMTQHLEEKLRLLKVIHLLEKTVRLFLDDEIEITDSAKAYYNYIHLENIIGKIELGILRAKSKDDLDLEILERSIRPELEYKFSNLWIDEAKFYAINNDYQYFVNH